jgi:hypothetical protein
MSSVNADCTSGFVRFSGAKMPLANILSMRSSEYCKSHRVNKSMLELAEGPQISSEQGLEPKDQVINVIERLNEQWEDRFTLNNPRLVENYVKGKLHFLVLIEEALKPGSYFIAYVERALPKLFIGDDVEIKRVTKVNTGRNPDPLVFEHAPGKPAPEEPGRSEVCYSGTNGYQEAVLVDVVKFVESPETVVPSLVRFGRVDSIYGRLRHALYFSFTRGFVFCGTVSVDYGKTDLLAFGLGKNDVLFGASDLHQVPREVIKGAPHLLEGFSGNQGDVSGQGLGTGEIMMRECVGKFRMWLDSNSVRLAVQEGFDSRFQVLDVLVGSRDLNANKTDSLTCG